MRNYYEILGVAQTATQADIKKAFRKLALKNHPDKTKSDPVKTELFQKMNEAHETLIDPRLKQRYDLTLQESNSNVGMNFTNFRQREEADEWSRKYAEERREAEEAQRLKRSRFSSEVLSVIDNLATKFSSWNTIITDLPDESIPYISDTYLLKVLREDVIWDVTLLLDINKYQTHITKAAWEYISSPDCLALIKSHRIDIKDFYDLPVAGLKDVKWKEFDSLCSTGGLRFRLKDFCNKPDDFRAVFFSAGCMQAFQSKLFSVDTFLHLETPSMDIMKKLTPNYVAVSNEILTRFPYDCGTSVLFFSGLYDAANPIADYLLRCKSYECYDKVGNGLWTSGDSIETLFLGNINKEIKLTTQGSSKYSDLNSLIENLKAEKQAFFASENPLMTVEMYVDNSIGLIGNTLSMIKSKRNIVSN